jgi:succinyl-diaminopimelate desuccinylase
VLFNFRYSTAVTEVELQGRAEEILKRHNLHYTIDWTLSGKPFLTESGKLVTAIREAILATSNITTELSTAGGTSDGRFIAPTGAEVVELGPINATIHQANEHVDVAELETLGNYYEQILVRLLT